MGQRILALELSDNHVRAAMADRSFKKLDLLGVYEQERIEGEPDLTGAVERIVKAAGIPDVAISALPSEFVAKRLLSLPFADRRRLQQVVPFALEEHLPFSVDDAAVAFTRVGRDESGTLVVAAIVRREVLREHLELLARAGLDPKIVTLNALALAGLLTRAHNGDHAAHLVVDIDHGCTSMVLVDSEGAPRAMRTVGQGLNSRPGALPPAVAGAIVGAVRQTLLAHGPDNDLDVVIAGPAADTPEIRMQIASAVEAPVRDLNDFDCSSMIDGSRNLAVRFTGCLAMLLGEAPANPLELINFREGEFAYHGTGGVAGALRRTAILAGVALASAVLCFLLSVSVNGRQLRVLNREISTTVSPALGEVDPAAAKSLLSAKIAATRKRLHMMGGNLGHGSPLDLLLSLSRAIPVGLPVEVNELQVDESGMKLEGNADSFATVDQVKRALERSRRFSAITVEHAAAGSDPSKVEFRMSMTANEAGDY